jgi:hypothetical protein
VTLSGDCAIFHAFGRYAHASFEWPLIPYRWGITHQYTLYVDQDWIVRSRIARDSDLICAAIQLSKGLMCPDIRNETLPCVSRPRLWSHWTDCFRAPGGRFLPFVSRDLRSSVTSCNVGTPTVWAVRYLTMNGRRCLIGLFNHGSMVYAPTQTCALQALGRGRKVISISGADGVYHRRKTL